MRRISETPGIGESRCAYLSGELDKPFVRIGFPVTDRGQHLPVCGYLGGLRIIKMISNALLDKVDRQCIIMPKVR